MIVGIDEAGRGPLVGSVIAAAVILPKDLRLDGLTDSKKLSAKKRATLEQQILEVVIDYAIAEATAAEIDQYNILQATFLAMSRAVAQLKTPRAQLSQILIDGNQVPPMLSDIGVAVVGGDALHAEISAASILAKESRDRQMLALDAQHPEYGFVQHKGYPTKAHFAALEQYGAIAEHRRSFKPVAKRLDLS